VIGNALFWTAVALPALVTAALGAIAWRHRELPGARIYAVVMACEALWMSAYAGELAAPDLPFKIALDHVQFVGLLAAIPLFVRFSLAFTGHRLRHPRVVWTALILTSAALSALLVLNPLDLRAGAHLVPATPVPVLTYPFTTVDYVAFLFTYVSLVPMVVLLVRHGRRAGRLARAQNRAVALGMTVPLLSGLITRTGVTVGGHRDFSPFSFGIGHLLVSWGLLRHRLFTVVPVAREVVVEQLVDPVFVLDAEGHLLDVNPAGAGLLGRESTGSVVGRPAAEVLPDWLAPHVVASDGAHSADVQAPTATGGVWYNVTTTPLDAQRSSPGGRVLVLRDVTARVAAAAALSRARDDLEHHVDLRTAELRASNARLTAEIAERRRALAAHRESELRFRAIFDGAFQFTGLLDTAGRLLEVNQTALAFLRVTLTEVQGRYYWDTPWWRHSPEGQALLKDAVARAARGETVRYEVTNQSGDGAVHWVDFSIKPVFDDAGRVTLLIPEGRDVTARRHEEEQRRVLESQLAQAQKMESIGRLAGGIAHDINNLLTVVLGNVALLELEPPPSVAERDAGLRDIRRAGESAAALTQQLLAFSRKQHVAPRVLDLNVHVEKLRRMLTRLLGENITLDTRFATELRAVRLDAGQLDQIVVNLAVNARDAMPNGGHLRITTDNVRLDPDALPAEVTDAQGDWVRLTLEDDGVGIPEDVQAQIFEPFFTTKGPGEGTGLGLAIVHGIVHQHGGFVTVRSSPGQGTRFALHFPSTAPVDEVAPDVAPAPKGSAATETIVLVEDQVGVRRVATLSLEHLGYRVLDFASGSEALRALRDDPSPIDLLVTDVVMPGLSGPALADALQVLRPGTPVLFVSGYTHEALPRDLAASGAALLPKPFTPAALGLKVRELLAQRPPAPDPATPDHAMP